MANGSLMKVNTFCNTFDLHSVTIGIENPFLVFFLIGCLKKYALYLSSKKYAKQNLNVESISYERVVQEGLRFKNFYL